MAAKKKDTTTQPDPLSVALGLRVAHWRSERRGLTPQQLAEVMGISPAYLWRIEDGRQNLSFRNLARLARALDVSLGELLEGIELDSVNLGNRAYVRRDSAD